MGNRWILITDNYEGLNKKAADILSGEISAHLQYVLPVITADKAERYELKECNVIVVGKTDSNFLLAECQRQGRITVPEKEEGYSIYVGESAWNPESQMIAIAGYDEKGVLYGCIDFCNKYCGDILYSGGDIWSESFFIAPFERKLREWSMNAAPAIKTRAIWTWGHVIYDYRKFLDNMLKLRLNEVVIWNDCLPLNAKDIVAYAHALGIKLIWGFAWGWGQKCAEILEQYDEHALLDLKKSVMEAYQNEYAPTGCDGIYFQSFTELNTDYVNGKCIAELVTDLVNDISGALLEINPDLHIQFGLHATSVKTHLEHLKKVDRRVHIIWEDCGAFPFHYYTDRVDGFEETLAFTSELLKLRGADENFGAVLKGMLKLDWGRFEHFSESYILGERTDDFLKQRQSMKNKIWKLVQAGWIKNAAYVGKMIGLIAKDGKAPIVQALVEDAMFENEVMFPVALYAEMLWTPEQPVNEMIGQVAKYPCVKFANT